MGENRRADGLGPARHLFCCSQAGGLIGGKIVAECTGSFTEERVTHAVKLLEYASTACWIGVAFLEFS